MGRLRFLLPSFLLLFFLFLAHPSNTLAQALPTVGANLSAYVSPTGGECNINVPAQYPTIQAGINAANNGDTVCVGPGVYGGNIRIDKPVRLSGSGYEKSFIINNLPLTGTIDLGRLTSDIIIEGFFIKGSDGSVPDYEYNSITLGEGSSNITVRYNYIATGEAGIALWTANSFPTNLAENNVFQGNNSMFICRGGDTNYLNNTFIGTVYTYSGLGVAIDSWNDALIERNIFYTTGSPRWDIITSVPTVIANENNFDGGPFIKVATWSSGMNAKNNWWGDADPSDNFYGNVDYVPFATSPFPEYPIPTPPTLPSNHLPAIISISPINSVLPNTPVDALSTFTDPDITDTHTATWDWGDGNTSTGSITESDGSGTVAGSHSYTSSGIYNVTLTLSDGIDSTTANTSVIILTPVQAINNIIDTVQVFNLQQGISNSLDSKLSAAVDSLNDLNTHNDVATINSLQAFINAVNAQRGNKITVAQADTLISQANVLVAYLNN